MRRIFRAAIFASILVLVVGFVVLTWAHFAGGVGVRWATAGALLALGYIPVAILGFRLQSPLLRAVAIPAAIAVGLLSFSFFASLACWLVAGAAHLLGLSPNPRGIAEGAFGLGFALAAFGLVNAARIRVTRYRVALRGLPPAWQGKTAVLVSDVHLGNIHGAAFARRIVARLNAIKPELVFIGGDLFDGARVDLAACVAPWGTLNAPRGAFFVTGNHDEFSDSATIIAALQKVGVRVLGAATVNVAGLQVVGIHDGAAHDAGALREFLARAKLDKSCASILLQHRPSHLAVVAEAGISLQLSGHTHLGQFWPWSKIVGRIYGPFAYGLNRYASLQVITSSGVGTWGPPLRLGTRSEIVVFELVADPARS